MLRYAGSMNPRLEIDSTLIYLLVVLDNVYVPSYSLQCIGIPQILCHVCYAKNYIVSTYVINSKIFDVSF